MKQNNYIIIWTSDNQLYSLNYAYNLMNYHIFDIVETNVSNKLVMIFANANLTIYLVFNLTLPSTFSLAANYSEYYRCDSKLIKQQTDSQSIGISPLPRASHFIYQKSMNCLVGTFYNYSSQLCEVMVCASILCSDCSFSIYYCSVCKNGTISYNGNCIYDTSLCLVNGCKQYNFSNSNCECLNCSVQYAFKSFTLC
jgi:hypothetical protein